MRIVYQKRRHDFWGVNFQEASVVVSLPNDPNRLGTT